MRRSVDLRRMADVPALDVADDLQTQIVGLVDQGVVRLQTFPEIFLEERDVDLDRRHHRRDDPHRLRAEVENRIHGGSRIEFVVHLAVAGDRGRQTAVHGIQPHNQGRLLRLHSFAQPIRKVARHSSRNLSFQMRQVTSLVRNCAPLARSKPLGGTESDANPATKSLFINVRTTIITPTRSGNTEFGFRAICRKLFPPARRTRMERDWILGSPGGRCAAHKIVPLRWFHRIAPT